MVISVIISCNRKLFLVMTSRMLWHLFLFLEKCPALLVMTPLLESVYAVAYTSLFFTLVDTYTVRRFYFATAVFALFLCEILIKFYTQWQF